MSFITSFILYNLSYAFSIENASVNILMELYMADFYHLHLSVKRFFFVKRVWARIENVFTEFIL